MDLATLAAQSIQVSRVAVTLTHSSGTVIQDDLAIANGTASGTFNNLAVGAWDVIVTIYDGSNNVLGTGRTTATVEASVTATVNLTVQLTGAGSLVVNVDWAWPASGLVACSNQTPITPTTSNSWAPALSPDGSKIAFLSNRNGDVDIFVMNTDGSNPVQVTSTADMEGSPTWSPDGTKIAFITNYTQISTVQSDGSSTSPTPIHDFADAANPSGVQMESLTWSADGKFAFVKNVTDPNTYEESQTIEITDDQGTSLATITAPQYVSLGYPAWSPDGSQIAFCRHNGSWNIWTADASGNNQIAIADSTSYSDYYPSWSQDGGSIFFVSERDGGQDIYRMNADGSSTVRLTNNDTNNYTNIDPTS